MVDIYVLECEDGNIYVGKTSKGIKRLKQHIDGRGAEWTKMHKPKRVMEYYTNATDSDERKITDQMIKKHGAKKVRGAGLTKRKMSQKELDNLNKKAGFKVESKKKQKNSVSKSTKCGRCGRSGHNRSQCYAKTTVDGKAVNTKKTRTRSSATSKIKNKASKRKAKQYSAPAMNYSLGSNNPFAPSLGNRTSSSVKPKRKISSSKKKTTRKSTRKKRR